MPKKQDKPQAARIATLSDDEGNRLEVIFAQIDGAAELLFKYLEVDSDNPATTGLNVIKEKAAQATTVIRAAFARNAGK